MKKVSLLVLIGSVFAFGAAADVELRLMGGYNIPDNSLYNNSIGFTAGFEFSPVTIRGRDTLYATVGGAYTSINADGIDDLPFYSGEFSLGYNLRLTDRFSIAAEGIAGVWSCSGDDTQNSDAASGIVYGGRGFVNFHALPELTAGIFGGYKIYSYNPEPLLKNMEFGIGIKYNLSKGIFGSSSVTAENPDEIQAGPLYPVFYSRYDDHSFGSVTFVNNEKNDISDVEVFVYIEQYMTNPTSTAKFDKVKLGESFTAELTAFLDESILNNLTSAKCDAKVIVKYRSLGKLMTSEQVIELTALSRNSATWKYDSKTTTAAAAFISGRDASATSFSKLVKIIVQDELSANKPENVQYGAALFGALKAYGINYVVDPSSSFTDNIGTDKVDFLQFPYQTLLYHGGDCDDLTIMNCALYESLGIDTAVILVPGHIYMAFDSGVSPANAAKALPDGMYVVQDGKVWIPQEITLTQDSFALQRSTGYKEWVKNKKDRVLIPLKTAWKEFNAVGIPDSDVKIEMPSRAVILKGFKNNNN